MTRTNWLILGLAVLAASIGGYVEHRHRQPDTSLIGQPLPAISLNDFAGNPQNLDKYRGRRVLLNFWASWCGPCLDEMPALDRAQRKFGDRGAIVVGVAMDDPELAKAFVATRPLNYPILLGDPDAPSTSEKLGDTAAVLPYSVLVGADGRVMAIHTGALSSEEITRWLDPSSQLSP